MSNPYTFVKEKLLKINGEYVKFYVTTNYKLPQLLANSGAAVIYHEAPTGLNYLYVGGELIASGYGFANMETRNKLADWSVNMDDILEALREADRQLNLTIQEIQTNIIQWASDAFVKSDGGDISKTVFTPSTEDIEIRTKDILGLLENITYDRMKMGEVVYTVTYSHPLSTTDEELTSTFLQSSYKALPIGSKLKNVNMLVTLSLNDSGPAESSKLTYYITNSRDNNNLSEKYNYVNNSNQPNNYASNLSNVLLGGDISKIMNNIYGSGELVVGNNDYQNYISYADQSNLITDECFSYSVQYNGSLNTEYIVKEGRNNVFKDFEIILKETPAEKYKAYSFSTKENGYDEPIYATQNIIKQETVSCLQEFGLDNSDDILHIEGTHIIYIVSTNREDIQFWKYPTYSDESEEYINMSLLEPYNDMISNKLLKRSNNNNGFKLLDLFEVAGSGNTIIQNNSSIESIWDYAEKNSFQIRVYEHQHTVLFTLPSIYDIEKIYYVNNQNDEVDLTGYFMYCGTEKFESGKSTIRNNSNINYSITTDTSLYYMYSIEGFSKGFMLTVKLRKRDSSEIVTPTNSLHIDFFNNEYHVLHQVDFDTEHWYDADMSYRDKDNNIYNSLGNQYTCKLLSDYIKKVNEYL